MAKKIVHDIRQLDGRILACRAGKHRWPSDDLEPGKQLPRGFRPSLQRDGTVLVSEDCRRCRKHVEYLTGDGGIWQRGAKRRYRNPDPWIVFKSGENKTKSDFTAELYRRLNEAFMAAAKRNAVPEVDL